MSNVFSQRCELDGTVISHSIIITCLPNKNFFQISGWINSSLNGKLQALAPLSARFVYAGFYCVQQMSRHVPTPRWLWAHLPSTRLSVECWYRPFNMLRPISFNNVQQAERQEKTSSILLRAKKTRGKKDAMLNSDRLVSMHTIVKGRCMRLCHRADHLETGGKPGHTNICILPSRPFAGQGHVTKSDHVNHKNRW